MSNHQDIGNYGDQKLKNIIDNGNALAAQKKHYENIKGAFLG